MNVLYYLSTFPKLSESFILNEIYELESRGHNIAVCAMNEPTGSIAHKEFDELEIPITYLDEPSVGDATELLSTKVINRRVLGQIRYRAPIQNHGAYLLRAKRCIDFVESLDWELDHVHTHFATRSKFSAKYVASYFGVPFTLTAHAVGLFERPIGKYTNTLLESADRIITISEYNRQHIREHFTDDTPIDIVRAGIRPEKFTPTGPSLPNRVLTVARFVEKKGHVYALEAIAKVAEAVPEIEYHLIGSGELEDQLQRTVRELGIDQHVSFLNNVDDQQLLEELDEANCFLLPCVISESGDRDGIPVSLMEAMAMKTPPISTTVSGIPELVDHETNGLLVTPRDPEQLAGAITTMIDDPDKWAEYAENARMKIDAEFNIQTESKKLEDVFEQQYNQ